MTGGNARQRRFLRRIYESSPFSDVKPEAETSWFARLTATKKAEVVVTVITAWIAFLGHPYLFALCASILALLFLNDFAGSKWVKDRLPKFWRVVCFVLSLVVLSGYFFYLARVYDLEHTPWCYGFFFEPITDTGYVGGNTIAFGVAAATFDNAHNVKVELRDATDSSAPINKSTIKELPIIPVIYSFKGHLGQQVFTPMDHPYLGGAVETEATFDSRKLGSLYDVTVNTDNGDDIRETIKLSNDPKSKWQCITITRILDQKVIIRNYTPQFDPFGGRTLPVSCDPNTSALWQWLMRLK